MEPYHETISQESVELIERLIEAERSAFEQHRLNASRAGEPQLTSLFAMLTEMHSQCYAELRTFIGEVKSQNEITRQINEMFL